MAVSSRRRGADLRDLSLKRVVDAIRPKAARYFVWDAAESGFGLDVWPSGTRTWVVFYRVLGVQRRMTLGSADEVAPDAARRKARAAKRVVDEDRDPLAERRSAKQGAQAAEVARRTAATFADVAARYTETLEKKRSARWAAESARILKVDILPVLGRVPIASLGVPEVERLHEAMSDRPVLANRAKSIVSAVVMRAVRDGDRPRDLLNPAPQIADYIERPRQRALTEREWKALATAWPKVRAEYADLPAWDTRATQLQAIEALVLTGARVGAVLPRRVGDVDLDARVVAVDPAHKFVTRILLGSAAVRALRPLVRGREARAYLFAGQPRRTGPRTRRGGADTRPQRAPTPITWVTPAWNRLRELAGIENLHLHDLRNVFGSVGGELQFSTFIVGGLLGHSAKGVTERHYIGRPDKLLLATADAISEEIARRLGFTKAAPKGKKGTK